MSKINILHLLSQTQLTGAETHAVTLAEEQTRCGHSVLILSDQLHTKTNIEFQPWQVHKAGFVQRIFLVFKLRKLLKERKIQIIHAHSRAAVRQAYWATRGLDCALVSTVHGQQHFSLSKVLFDLYGEKVIPVCENIASDLIQNLKMCSKKIHVLGNPMRFPPLGSPPPLPPTNMKLAWIGRTTGPKGDRLKEGIESTFEILLKEFPELEIHVIGGELKDLGPDGERLWAELSQKYSSRLKHFSFLENLEQKITDYNLVIGAGRVALTALGLGVPLWALGEAENLGLVHVGNFFEAQKSNFGDVKGNAQANSMSQFTSEMLVYLRHLKNNLQSNHPDSAEQLQELVRAHYSVENITKKVLHLYRMALFSKRFPKWIPILMYHKVVEKPLQTKHRIFVTVDTFEKHLSFLHKLGFTCLSFAELKQFIELKKDFSLFPKKPVILTFDDGYKNNLELAAPLLKKYNMKATLFLLAENLKENVWDKADGTPQLPLLTPEERQKLIQNNFEIGSHGFHHSKLSEMNQQQTWTEVFESKNRLEKEFRIPITCYAYTYGIKNKFAEEAAEKAGYSFAVNTSTGGFHLSENPWSLFRVPIFPEDGVLSLWKKTRPWYRKYFFRKRGS